MPSVVQVLGPGRSGTTMLHLMLGNADNAFACGEIYAFFRPWRTHHFQPKCSCGRSFGDCVWRRFDGVHERGFHRTLADALQVAWVVDESKRLGWLLDSQRWALRTNMDIFNIVMVKDPLALMYSAWKRGVRVSAARESFITYNRRILKLGLPFVSVSLEELAADPSRKLSTICAAIGMEYFPGKENFWERRHCHLFGSLGVRRQVESGHSQIESADQASPYPQEFLDAAEAELRKRNNRRKLYEIYKRIMANEVDKVDGYRGEPQPLDRALYPWWYYGQLLKSKYQKHFPQRWHLPE